MGLQRSRTITLVVAIATLTSNVLSSILFHQLPDDPHHLANNFSWYLHFANILSVFGFVGALRQHPLSIAIFANYLILDTILCAIPRFLILGLLQELSSDICTPSISLTSPSFAPLNSQFLSTTSPTSSEPALPPFFSSIGDNWTPHGCYRIVALAQLTMAAGVIAATLLQFVGALAVREYAKALWMREVREEASVALSEETGLPVIFEDREEVVVDEKI